MGTVILSSMPVIPSIYSLVQACKHMRSSKNRENYFFYCTSKLLLMLSMSSAALTFSSIYGTGFVKSTQKTFDTLLRRCLLYLATIGVCRYLKFYFAIFIYLMLFYESFRQSMHYLPQMRWVCVFSF